MQSENTATNDGQDEAVVVFSSVEHAHEDYRFAASSQMSVLAMGMLSAVAAVLMLAGIEASVQYSVASGWIDAPPSPKFYASLVNQS